MTSGNTTQRARLKLASSSTVLALSCAVMANVGCSSDNKNNGSADAGGTSSTGGSTSTGTGGKATGTGGKAGTGGTSTAGATGGAAATTGGAKATGGASAATGGTASTTGGAASATGGSTSAATGGTTTTATGGTAATTGGTTSTAGTSAVATGGSTTNGGTTANGGTGTTGGSSSVAGSTSVGGTTANGGTSTAGGASSTGGTSTAGGASSTGGATSSGGTGATLRNIEIDMTGMNPHLNQLMEFRIVSAANQLVFRGILDTLPTVAYNYIMPKSVPDGDYHLDFFADLNHNGVYDPPTSPTTYLDHQWRVTIPTPGSQVLAFAHNTNFTDISTPATTPIGGDFAFQATGMTPHLTQLFELRVIIASTGQVVGRYVLSSVPAAAFNLTIAGVIANSTQYNIDFYADLNGNGHYDPPGSGDHAWRVTAAGTATGLTVPFAHNTNFTDVGF